MKGDKPMSSRRLWYLLLLPMLVFPAMSAQAPSGMQVILLGTGYPRPDPERAGPSGAVLVGQEMFLINAGRGVVLRMAAAELPLKGLRAVFLTHLHSRVSYLLDTCLTHKLANRVAKALRPSPSTGLHRSTPQAVLGIPRFYKTNSTI